MSEPKNDTEGLIEQNDDKDVNVNTANDSIVEIVKNELVVNHEKANTPQGG